MEDLKIEIQELKNSIDTLNESVTNLVTIQQDILNCDSSHDDITSLKGKLQSLIDAIEKNTKKME